MLLFLDQWILYYIWYYVYIEWRYYINCPVVDPGFSQAPGERSLTFVKKRNTKILRFYIQKLKFVRQCVLQKGWCYLQVGGQCPAHEAMTQDRPPMTIIYSYSRDHSAEGMRYHITDIHRRQTYCHIIHMYQITNYNVTTYPIVIQFW